MMLLSTIPPLDFKVMDPLVEAMSMADDPSEKMSVAVANDRR